MEKYVMQFMDIRKQDVAIAGGKGANLGEMVCAGFPVPLGVVVTADAYGKFMEENGIGISEIMKNAESTENAVSYIRKAIVSGEIPADIKEQIVGFYLTLGANARVAVRSSATAEDLDDASFAGQQETYLNVIGEEALLQKVKECYASLWSSRAISYRKAQGYDRQKVALAIVLQQMFESESAGVIFTKNPAGNSDDILINASYGLGEAIVSGIVSPDEYICSRDGNIKKSVIGSKEIQIVYDGQGTKKESVSEEKRKQQVLDTELVRHLVTEALKIEAHYNRPMDIEWAVKDGKIYILQARSITTIGDEPQKHFSDADFVGLPVIKPAKGWMRENVLFNLEKLPKPYFPLDHDFGDAVGKQKEVLIAEVGLSMNAMCPINEYGISSFRPGGIKPNRNIVRLPGILKQMKDEEYNIRKSSESLRSCTERFEQEKALTCVSIQELGESLRRMQVLIGDTAYGRFRYAVFPQVLENISLGKTLKKVDKTLNSFDLMEGLDYVTADVNRAMADIARCIKENTDEQKTVMSLPISEITRKCPDLSVAFDGFMEKYGNRSDFNCYCFIAKSWNDDPDRFLGTLRTMLRSKDAKILSKQESDAKFEALMKHVKDTIGEKTYARFAAKVEAVRHYHTIREATQYLWESEFAYCRTLLRSCADGLDVSYNDLLYLFAGELFEACNKGRLDDGARALIAKRKAKRPLAEAYWNKCIEESLATGNSDIIGVSGSGGTATGKVCIIKSPAEFDKLQPGEILVCTYTDPEWTPLFTLAAGVVVDTGGTLSHAAIVAREYKIPAVLATGDATKKLKDGEFVVVDGTNGIVTVG
jgi:phosphohistidine swiveling domain-containing protein